MKASFALKIAMAALIVSVAVAVAVIYGGCENPGKVVTEYAETKEGLDFYEIPRTPASFDAWLAEEWGAIRRLPSYPSISPGDATVSGCLELAGPGSMAIDGVKGRIGDIVTADIRLNLHEPIDAYGIDLFYPAGILEPVDARPIDGDWYGSGWAVAPCGCGIRLGAFGGPWQTGPGEVTLWEVDFRIVGEGTGDFAWAKIVDDIWFYPDRTDCPTPIWDATANVAQWGTLEGPGDLQVNALRYVAPAERPYHRVTHRAYYLPEGPYSAFELSLKVPAMLTPYAYGPVYGDGPTAGWDVFYDWDDAERILHIAGNGEYDDTARTGYFLRFLWRVEGPTDGLASWDVLNFSVSP